MEDEHHFLFVCDALDEVRSECYAQFIQNVEGFKALPDGDKMKHLMSKDMVKKLGFWLKIVLPKDGLYKPK